jgi:hypothetical protein
MDQAMNAQEAKLRAYAQTSVGEGLQATPDVPCRVGLRERAARQLGERQMHISKGARLEELMYLLDKNPDIARILDLVEEVRG